MNMTKACAALLLAASILLSGCAGREHPPGGPSGQEAGSSPAGGEALRPIPLGQGLADLGRALFPSPAGPVSGRLLPGGRVLAWTEDQTVLYDLGSGAVLHRTHLPIRRLGTEHF